MAEFESAHAFETKIEHLCGVILRLDAENWEPRNKALLQIISMVTHIEEDDEDRIHDFINPKLFKTLKEPIKHLISDLRSQQVRDACQLLIKLSEIHPDGMKSFLREAFAFIIEGIKVPNKVMSGYVDECISLLIKNCCFKSSIIYMVNEMRENKAKVVRERCMEYLNDILMNWNLTDSEADPVADAVRIGLEDASVKCRETARTLYFNIFQMFPKKAVKIKLQVSKPLQQKLNSAEKEMGLENSLSSSRSAEDLNASISSTASASESMSGSGTPRLKKAASRAQISKPGISSSSSSSSSSNGISSNNTVGGIHSKSQAITSSSQSQVPRLTKRASVNDMHSNNGASSRSLLPAADSYSHAKSTLDMRQLVSGSKTTSSSSSGIGGATPSASKPVIKLRGGGGGGGSSNVVATTAATVTTAAALTQDMASVSMDSVASNSTQAEPATAVIPAQQSDLKAAMSRRRSVVKNPFEQMMAVPASSSSSSSAPPVAVAVAGIPAATAVPPPPVSSSVSSATLPQAADKKQLSSSIDRAISAAYKTVASSNEALSNSGSYNSSPHHHHHHNHPPSPQRTKSTESWADGDSKTKTADVVVASTPPAKVPLAPVATSGKSIQLNQRVVVTRTNNSSLCGTIRFIGHTMFASGQWVGVELDAPEGKNNGSVMGHYYFSCVPNYGLFAREDCIEPLPPSARSSPQQPIPPIPPQAAAAVSSAINDITLSVTADNIVASSSEPQTASAPAPTRGPSVATAPSPPRMTVAERKLSSANLRDIMVNPDTSTATATGVATAMVPHVASIVQVKEPSTVPNSNKNDDNDNHKLNTPEAADELTGILKLKLSSLMDYLNQQLEIVVDLEKESAALRANPSSTTSVSAMLELRDEVIAITEQEQQLIESFKRRLFEKF